MSDSGLHYGMGRHKLAPMSWHPTLRLDEDKQGATLVDGGVRGLELWHFTFEELVEFRDQVCDVWRLAHAARRAEQAKEDLL